MIYLSEFHVENWNLSRYGAWRRAESSRPADSEQWEVQRDAQGIPPHHQHQDLCWRQEKRGSVWGKSSFSSIYPMVDHYCACYVSILYICFQFRCGTVKDKHVFAVMDFKSVGWRKADLTPPTTQPYNRNPSELGWTQLYFYFKHKCNQKCFTGITIAVTHTRERACVR